MADSTDKIENNEKIGTPVGISLLGVLILLVCLPICLWILSPFFAVLWSMLAACLGG